MQSQVVPADVIRNADHGRARFLTMYGDTLLLLVTLADDYAELETGLAFAASETTTQSLRPEGPPLQFRTQLQSIGHLEAYGMARSLDPATLSNRLRKDRHFVVPFRKRHDSGGLSAERITVGRAFNQDIVLRHGSVSKFHAWVQMDDAHGVQIADAGSRNGTRLNDEPLPARSLSPVRPGDLVRFGSVNAMVCDAETLFEVLTTG